MTTNDDYDETGVRIRRNAFKRMIRDVFALLVAIAILALLWSMIEPSESRLSTLGRIIDAAAIAIGTGLVLVRIVLYISFRRNTDKYLDATSEMAEQDEEPEVNLPPSTPEDSLKVALAGGVAGLGLTCAGTWGIWDALSSLHSAWGRVVVIALALLALLIGVVFLTGACINFSRGLQGKGLAKDHIRKRNQ